jgi:hypothetical protein
MMQPGHRAWIEQLTHFHPELEVKNINIVGNWISFKAGFKSSAQITTENIIQRIVNMNQNIRAYMGNANHLFQNALLFVYQQDPPRFTVKNLVQLCWGLTLNLSHIEQQNKIGQTLTEQIIKLLGEDVDKSFLRNLTMTLAQAQRTIAFARDAHVRYLEANAKDLADKKTFWNDVTQLASFSKEGLPVQILSFLGVGSFGALQNMVKIGDTGLNFSTSFIMFGVLGIMAVYGALKVVGHFYVKSKEKTILKKQNRYYTHNFKRDMTSCLFNFYKDVRELVKIYYADCYPAINEFDGQTDGQIKSYIYNYMLPSSNINWPSWPEKTLVKN